MTALALAFLAGLLGGVHCVGMCGGLVLVASAGGRPSWPFHVGRVVSYAALGAAAAAAGSLLELGGTLARPQLLRGAFGGALLLLFGSAFLGVVPRRWLEPPSRLFGAAVAGARRAGDAFPLLLGLAAGLLPCGLLYPMYAAAVASGSPARGAALLLTFGIGTVPLLGACSFVLDRVGVTTRQALVRAVGIVMLALGAFLIWQAATAPAPGHPTPMPAAAPPS